MSRWTLPLQRARLEVDQTLRSRAFFARAVRGRLSRGEYLDLLTQLGLLLFAFSRERSADLLALVGDDCAALGRGARLQPLGGPGPCPTTALIARHQPSFASYTVWGEVGLALLGTSWTCDASRRLEIAYPQSTRFLSALCRRATQALLTVEQAVAAAELDAQGAYALAELSRGGVLGLATYLDSTWPPPAVAISRWS